MSSPSSSEAPLSPQIAVVRGVSYLQPTLPPQNRLRPSFHTPVGRRAPTSVISFITPIPQFTSSLLNQQAPISHDTFLTPTVQGRGFVSQLVGYYRANWSRTPSPEAIQRLLMTNGNDITTTVASTSTPTTSAQPFFSTATPGALTSLSFSSSFGTTTPSVSSAGISSSASQCEPTADQVWSLILEQGKALQSLAVEVRQLGAMHQGQLPCSSHLAASSSAPPPTLLLPQPSLSSQSLFTPVAPASFMSTSQPQSTSHIAQSAQSHHSPILLSNVPITQQPPTGSLLNDGAHAPFFVHSLPNLDQFSGDSAIDKQKWSRWIERFELRMIATRVPPQFWPMCLSEYLTGTAYELYSGITRMSPRADFDEVKRKLCDYYEPKKPASLSYSQLAVTTWDRHGTESLQNFVTKLFVLAQEGLPTADQGTHETIVCTHFLRCLPPHWKDRISQTCNVESIDDFLRLAIKCQAEEKADKEIASINEQVRLQSGAHKSVRPQSSGKPQMADNRSAHTDSGWKSRQLDVAGQSLTELTGKNYQERQNLKAQRKCFKCESPEHILSECPHRDEMVNVLKGNVSPGRQTDGCVRRDSGLEELNRLLTDDKLLATVVSADAGGKVGAAGMHLSVDLQLFGQPVTGTLDTGSGITVVGLSPLRELVKAKGKRAILSRCRPSKGSFLSISNEPITFQGEIDLDFTLDGVTKSVPCFINTQSPCPLLVGTSFIERFGMTCSLGSVNTCWKLSADCISRNAFGSASFSDQECVCCFLVPPPITYDHVDTPKKPPQSKDNGGTPLAKEGEVCDKSANHCRRQPIKADETPLSVKTGDIADKAMPLCVSSLSHLRSPNAAVRWKTNANSKVEQFVFCDHNHLQSLHNGIGGLVQPKTPLHLLLVMPLVHQLQLSFSPHRYLNLFICNLISHSHHHNLTLQTSNMNISSSIKVVHTLPAARIEHNARVYYKSYLHTTKADQLAPAMRPRIRHQPLDGERTELDRSRGVVPGGDMVSSIRAVERRQSQNEQSPLLTADAPFRPKRLEG